jgi:hypothetical protein
MNHDLLRKGIPSDSAGSENALEGENFVKDSEVRGIVLKELYEIRHTNPHAAIPADVPGLLEIDPNVLLGVLRQLRDKGLIEFGP